MTSWRRRQVIVLLCSLLVAEAGVPEGTLRSVYIFNFPVALSLQLLFNRTTLCQRGICCHRVSVCLSVTSRYCIETTGRIDRVFGTEASFHLYHTVCYGNLSISKNFGTSLWNFVPNFGRKFRRGKSIALSTTRRRRRRSSLLTTPIRQSTSLLQVDQP